MKMHGIANPKKKITVLFEYCVFTPGVTNSTFHCNWRREVFAVLKFAFHRCLLNSDDYAGGKRTPIYTMQAAPHRTMSSKVLIDDLMDAAANN